MISGLLLAKDGKFSRKERFAWVASGNIQELVAWLLERSQRTSRRREAPGEDLKSRKERAAALGHHHGGISKGASVLLAQPRAPGKEETFNILVPKHLSENQDELRQAITDTKDRVQGNARYGEQRYCPPEGVYTPTSLRKAFMRANSNSAPGLDGIH
ncbi:unnamed protein product [Choristocarpus tenellus]